MNVSRRRARSRRDFLKLVAAGSAAAIAAPAAAAETPAAKAAPRQRRARTGEPATHPRLEGEVEKQKQYTEETLKKIRDYSLPPGSAPAMVFRPLAPKRNARGGR